MSSEEVTLEVVLPDWQKARALSESRILARARGLFSVHVSQPALHGQWPWIAVCGTPDRTENAKRYILAACAPEFQTQVSGGARVSHLLFGRTTPLRDELERDYQVYIQPSQTGTWVLGGEYAVFHAVSRLTRLIETMESGVRLIDSPPPHPAPAPTTHAQPSSSVSSPDLDQQLKDVIQKINNLPEDHRKALREGLQEDIKSGLIPRDTGVSDSQLEQRIQYFVKLDYPREKVVTVLESLGPEATDNDVLSRLVRVCSYGPTSEVGGGRPGRLCNSRPRGFGGELPQPSSEMDPALLRPVVIDGSNVAMRHGNGQVFSCRGILLAVEWFLKRGHREITVFVPSWRKEASQPDSPITDQEILTQLEKERYLVFTPSRKIGQKRIVCYDDRFIVRLATQIKGVIVSNDTFKDLVQENPEWRGTIERRLIMFTFVGDFFMVPDDPLGRRGITLNELLLRDPRTVPSKGSGTDKQQERCPYGDRCTFGRKCRYYHPEREAKQPTEQNISGSRSPLRGATPTPAPLSSTRSSREDLRLLHSNNSSSDSLYLTERDSGSGEKGLVERIAPPPGLDLQELSDRVNRMGLQDRYSYIPPRVIEPSLMDVPSILPPSVSSASHRPSLTSPNQMLDGHRHRPVTYPMANLSTSSGSSNNTQIHSLAHEDALQWPPLAHSYSQGSIIPHAYPEMPSDRRVPFPRDTSYSLAATTLQPPTPSFPHPSRDTPPSLIPRDTDALGQSSRLQHPYQPQVDSRTPYGYPHHHLVPGSAFHSVPSRLSELSTPRRIQDSRLRYGQHGHHSVQQPQQHGYFFPSEREHAHQRDTYGYSHATPHHDRAHRRESFPHLHSHPLPTHPHPNNPSYSYKYGHVDPTAISQSNGMYASCHNSLYRNALAILPKCEDRILRVLQMNPQLNDLEQLVRLVQNLD